MVNNSGTLYHVDKLDKKIDRTGDDIKSRLSNLEDTCAKADEVKQHYATKFFCGTIATAFFIALCTAYVVVTPLLIDSKNSKLDQHIYKILEILESKLQIETK